MTLSQDATVLFGATDAMAMMKEVLGVPFPLDGQKFLVVVSPVSGKEQTDFS